MANLADIAGIPPIRVVDDTNTTCMDSVNRALRVITVTAPPAGSGGGGTSSTFGTTFPTMGTAIGVEDTGGNMAPLKLDNSGLIKVNGSGVVQPVSGTITALQGTNPWSISGPVNASQTGNWTIQPGNTPNTIPWLITLNQGGNSATVTPANALKTDSSAVIQPTYQYPSNKAYYSSLVSQLTLPATPQDVWTIFGSATKVIRVMWFKIMATQTTASQLKFALTRRITANTGGSPLIPTIVPRDGNNPLATATVLVYTSANPTLGTSIGDQDHLRFRIPAPGDVVPDPVHLIDFTNHGEDSGVVLRGTNQGLCLNLLGTAIPAGFTMIVQWFWSEE
jgi:hypothetical protein